ncbi:hypothetical protein ABN183_10370 [Proteus vulgaris]|jgi:predicted phage tail protein|uniref:hypothetical protein n=1 Tax=Proteus TaxID=583 RepID=UPI000A3DB0D5|nr:hypothetical protein [Proteus vulgaris]
MLLSDVPYPSKTYEMAGLSADVAFYFRARLVDKTGNQSINLNGLNLFGENRSLM